MNIANVVGAIASLSWLLVVGAFALTVIRASRGRGTKGSVPMIGLAIVIALVLTTVSQGLVFIQPEERGMVISAVAPQGYREEALQPGLRWVIPYLEDVITYPISKQSYTMSISPIAEEGVGDDSVAARTADGQEIYVDASVIFQIDPAQVVLVHITWQNRYVDELIRPLARAVIRDAVSQFGVEEIVTTNRFELQETIQSDMSARLLENGLLLQEFVLRNITFTPEYAASVEQKQIAEQLAQQAAFTVEQRRQEAEQARQTAQGLADSAAIAAEGEARAIVIAAQAQAEARLIQAQAEAEALRLLAEAIKDNPDILTLQYIEKLAPNISVMLLPADNPFLFPLPEIGPPAPTATPVPTATPTVEPTVEPTPTTTP
ncbi:MAG: hypothetical protein Fur0022_32920 [Anaerolineales bacterium]